MRDLKTASRVGLVLAVGVAALHATSCRAPARDMPVVVTPDGQGGAVVAFPVCAGERVRSVLVARDKATITWRVDYSVARPMSEDTIVELQFGVDGFDGTSQLPGSRIVSGAEHAPVSEPFYALLGLDIFAGDGEANLDVDWLADQSARQFVFAKFPWKDGDIDVETVTEAEGRARLLEWCAS